MLMGIPGFALHLIALWRQERIGFLHILTSITSGGPIHRGYLLSLVLLGCGSCLVVGALIEALCIAIARFFAQSRLRDP
jgi:hypothetical protein